MGTHVHAVVTRLLSGNEANVGVGSRLKRRSGEQGPEEGEGGEEG